MSLDIPLCIVSGEVRKLVLYENPLSLLEFQEVLKKEFKIPNQSTIKLIDSNRNAEITSVKLFNSNHDILIISQNGKEDNLDEPNLDLNDLQNSNNIEFKELINKKYKEEDLLYQLNVWANKKKFKLYISEGIKERKDGFKITLSCNHKNCKYRLIFLSTCEGGREFKVDSKLSAKYTNHSKSLFHCQ